MTNYNTMSKESFQRCVCHETDTPNSPLWNVEYLQRKFDLVITWWNVWWKKWEDKFDKKANFSLPEDHYYWLLSNTRAVIIWTKQQILNFLNPNAKKWKI